MHYYAQTDYGIDISRDAAYGELTSFLKANEKRSVHKKSKAGVLTTGDIEGFLQHEETVILFPKDVVQKASLPGSITGALSFLVRKAIVINGLYGLLRYFYCIYVHNTRNDELCKLTWECIEEYVSEGGSKAFKVTLAFPTKTHPGGDNHWYFITDTDGTQYSPYYIMKRYSSSTH